MASLVLWLHSQLFCLGFVEHLPVFACFLLSTATDSSFPCPQVAHFSKYGLQDSDEEEEVPPKTDPKKQKTTVLPLSLRLAQQLPNSQQQVAPQAQVEQPAVINTPHFASSLTC